MGDYNLQRSGAKRITKGWLQERIEVQKAFNKQRAQLRSAITGLLKRCDVGLFGRSEAGIEMPVPVGVKCVVLLDE